MSELKAINAYRLTTNTEDSDVYIHNDEFGCGGDLVECYLKSEADKVIAELRAQIVQADAECANALKEKLVEHATLREWAELQLRHQKYKRCLDKANYWGLVGSCTHGLIQLKCMRRELKFRKLAEKFKEAK